ncbi:glycosyltransferase [Nonomuraea phyllanthi]|uniref:Glycosyltransferase n=1 Tax=Nonomuraea phyllanthi TaxID=2219224 RepID=A0A5C4WPA2_9ACTN|nr:glycosyltransferase family 4 protein [Nonomuraea phyllanthi]KAB8195166.1 glycosyltransferase [Nonomuraea phyllanthi]QFY10702.1 glycosyltransferase [Nonomuraea phyllanthi]
MRIAYVINQFPPNITAGLGRYAELITPYLARDHDLTVHTPNDGRHPVDEAAGRLRVHRPRGALARGRRLNRTRRAEFLLLALNVVAANWRYFLRLCRRDARPDLVAVHDSTNFLSGLLCHYVLRLPVVLHVHTTEYGVAPQRSITDPLNLFAALERRLARVSRRVVVATPEVRDQLLAAGWRRTPIDVVPLGGTFEAVLPSYGRDELRAGARTLRARLGLPEGDPVLLFVGRIERQKGVYQLLEAMRTVACEVPRLRLVIVGEGDAAGVERIVASTGLEGRVLASGRFVEGRELLEYYELADACVFPSLFEPFGLVATEAMAMGRAAVLGDGFSRLFLGPDPERPAAYFVRAGEPADIARGVIAVMTDAGLRRELAERGERFVREGLNWERAAAETAEVYRAAVKTPAR